MQHSSTVLPDQLKPCVCRAGSAVHCPEDCLAASLPCQGVPRVTVGGLPALCASCLAPTELSRSSWLSSMAFIPPERCLSLELPTGLTSWTQLCSGRAGTAHPILPSGSSLELLRQQGAGLCPHHVPSKETVPKAPWPWLGGGKGNQEEWL